MNASDKTYRVGLLGAGWVAGEHAKAYIANPHTRVTAIASRSGTSARHLAEQYGLDAETTDRWQDVVESDRVDVVSVCTPPNLHAEQTVAAATTGKHILLEKAAALTIGDLRRMDRAVQEAGVKTVVSFVLRWNPLFDCIRALLKQDAIGSIFYSEVDYWHGIGPWYGQYKWNIKKDIGGSSLLSAGCHAVDALRWFVGTKVTEVFAYSTRIWQDYEYDPTLAGVLRFEDGTVGKVSSSIECTVPYQFNVNLLGEHGAIRDNRVYSTSLFPRQTGFAEIPTVLPDSGDVTHHPFVEEIDHFVQCLLEDRESHTNLADAVKTHEIVFALDRSAEEGRPVPVPPDA